MLGLFRLQFQGTTFVTSSNILQAKIERGKISISSEWISLECYDICSLVVQTPSKANTEGHRRRCKWIKTKMENYVICRTSLPSQQEVNRAIQETVGQNLDTFCNDCLHKQHAHDNLSASAKAPTKTGKTPSTAIH